MAICDKGIDIRQDSSQLLIRVALTDADGAIVTTGISTVYIYEVQSDGSLYGYDFDSPYDFSATPTNDEDTLTHQAVNSVDSGIWTKAITNISNFTENGIYIIRVTNTNAVPDEQFREFQWSGGVLSDVTQVGGITQRATDLAEIAQYLIANSATLTDKVADNSILAHILAHSGTVADYDDTTDSLEAIRDHGDATWTTAAAGLAVDLTKIHGSDLNEDSAGQLAEAFKKFFDVATPTGTINSLPGSAPNTVGGLTTEDINGYVEAAVKSMDADTINNAAFAADVGSTVYASNIIALAVRKALDEIHLDHIFNTTYDPANKPGASDALLNELVENDSGESRFTENALEQAPGGTTTGKVTWDVSLQDSEGSGVSGAVVYVSTTNSWAGLVSKETTDDNGDASFSLDASTAYYYTVTKSGYEEEDWTSFTSPAS